MSKLAAIIHSAAVLFGIEQAVAPTVTSTKQETTNMPEASQTPAAPAAPAADSDTLLANIKKVLTTAGHDVEQVWDEVVALAKKLG